MACLDALLFVVSIGETVEQHYLCTRESRDSAEWSTNQLRFGMNHGDSRKRVIAYLVDKLVGSGTLLGGNPLRWFKKQDSISNMVTNDIVFRIRRGRFFVFDRRMNRALSQIRVGRYFGRQNGVQNHHSAHHLRMTPNTHCHIIGESVVYREATDIGTPRKERWDEEGSLRFMRSRWSTRKRKSPPTICPSPRAVALNSLYVLLEISAIDKLDREQTSFLLEPDATSTHHHTEVEERDSELHRHTAIIKERNGWLEEGQHRSDDIHPEQLFPERYQQSPHRTQQHYMKPLSIANTWRPAW